ncbi:hypothetical protein ABPG75_005368 [Micractinium tetrahymenae]
MEVTAKAPGAGSRLALESEDWAACHAASAAAAAQPLSHSALALQAEVASLVAQGCQDLAELSSPSTGELLQMFRAAMAAVLGSGCRSLPAVAAALASWPGQQAAMLASRQLSAVDGYLVLLKERLPPGATEQAAQLYDPRRFIAWLRGATALLLAVGAREGRPSGFALAGHAAICAKVLASLDIQARFPLGPAREALGGDAELPRLLVRLFLRHSLPYGGETAGLLSTDDLASIRGAGQASSGGHGSGGAGREGSSGSASEVQGAWWLLANCLLPLGHPRLQPALQAHAHSAEGPVLLLRLAVALLRGMPARRPDGVEEHFFLGTQDCLPDLLSHAAPAFSTCECCRQRAGSAAHEAEVQEAAWLLLGLTPLAAAVREHAAAAPPECLAGDAAATGEATPAADAAWREYNILCSVCESWTVSLTPAAGVDGFRSVTQVAQVCQAAVGGLSLLPLLLPLGHPSHAARRRLTASNGGCPPVYGPESIAQLAMAVSKIYLGAGSRALIWAARQARLGSVGWLGRAAQALAAGGLPLGAAGMAALRSAAAAAVAQGEGTAALRAELAALVRPVFQMHVASCRLVHWALALPPGLRQQLPAALLTWQNMLRHGMGASYDALHTLVAPSAHADGQIAAELPQAEAERLLRCAAVAHLEAFSAVAASLSAEEFAGVLDPGLQLCRQVAFALRDVPAVHLMPEVATALRALLHAAAQHPPAAGQSATSAQGITFGERVSNLLHLSIELSPRPRLAAFLVGSQLLPLLQQAFKAGLAACRRGAPAPVLLDANRSAMVCFNELREGLQSLIAHAHELALQVQQAQQAQQAQQRPNMPSSSGGGGSAPVGFACASGARDAAAGSSDRSGDGSEAAELQQLCARVAAAHHQVCATAGELSEEYYQSTDVVATGEEHLERKHHGMAAM